MDRYFFLTYLLIITTSLVHLPTIKAVDHIPNHPRLLWEASEEKQVLDIISGDTVMAKLHEYIIKCADDKLNVPILEREIVGSRMLAVSREAIKRLLYLSYAFRLTQENRYADRAIEELMRVCGFSDWNQRHFLDVAEMAMGVAIGYDWLYDRLSQQERSFIETALREKALIPTVNNKNLRFFKSKDNWNQVCNTALIFASMSIIETDKIFYDNIIRNSVESNKKALEIYGPEGAYAEGYNYWSYGTIYQVMLIDLIKKIYKNDYGLENTPGFLESAQFIQLMATPTGRCFNFGDSTSLAKGQIPLFWFAAHLQDSSLIYQELKRLENNNYYFAEDRFLPLIIIWSSKVEELKLITPQINSQTYRGEVPLFIYKSGWESRKETYLAVKGGSALTSHAHMDAGEFIYEYAGIRWADDLGMQDYNSIEKHGVNLWDTSQNGERWEVLRFRNDFHNTITIDGERHILKGKSEILKSNINQAYKGVTLDLSSVLGDKVSEEIREIFLDEKDLLSVIDSIEVGNNAIEFTWTMVTSATANIEDDKTISLEKSSKKMNIVFSHDIENKKNFELNIWSTDPIHEYDALNPGKTRIGFKAWLPAKEIIKFTIKFIPEEIEL